MFDWGHLCTFRKEHTIISGLYTQSVQKVHEDATHVSQVFGGPKLRFRTLRTLSRIVYSFCTQATNLAPTTTIFDYRREVEKLFHVLSLLPDGLS